MDFLSIDYLEKLADRHVVPFAINLVLALLIFYAGRTIARMLVGVMRKLLIRAKFDESLTKFLTDLAYGLLLVVVVIASLEKVGIQTTAAIAVLGAMGLALGLALQGSLGNFASGVMIIMFRPYQVGDLVKLADHVGHVDAIKVFNTTIITLDNRTIIIPNGNITGQVIENISALGKIRIDLVFGIGYQDDIRKAKQVMMDVLTADDRVLTDPAPTVAVLELGDSSVNFAVRPWVDPAVYWDVYFDVTERIKLALDENGITIPFPQRDVHLYQSEAKRAA
jgi:small conductance mechanosensitive channel